jgi:hypothetical protein
MTINASGRRFGIEVECVIPTQHREEFPVGGYHNGAQIPWAPVGWNCQSDGSIRTEAGYFAAEVVSPPLAGEEGLVELVFVLDKLAEIGAKVNPSCGFHIHVDAGDLTPEQVGNVTESFKNLETLLFQTNGQLAEQRWNNHYCRRSDAWDGGRYQSLNLTNYFDPSGRARREGKRTVEFRLFALDKVDAKRAVALVYMAVALVVRSVNDGVMSITENAGIREYVHQNFTKTECRIVEDGPVWDIAKVLYRNVQQATV